jgi:hypothetical protein
VRGSHRAISDVVPHRTLANAVGRIDKVTLRARRSVMFDGSKNGFRLAGEARLTDRREQGAVGEVDPAVFDGEAVV